MIDLAAFDTETVRKYTEAGYWDPESMAERIATHARTNPLGAAFIDSEITMTWSEYDQTSTAIGATVAGLGAERGDRIAVMMRDSGLVHAAYVGLEKAGVVAVGIGSRSGVSEIRHLLEKTGATWLITEPEHARRPAADVVKDLRDCGIELSHHLVLTRDGQNRPALLHEGSQLELTNHPPLDPERALDANDLFFINSTSGTTGLPKCVTQTHNRWKYFHQLAQAAGDLKTEDRFLSLISAPFGFGLWTQHFTPTLLGSPTVIMRNFNAKDALQAIEREKVTVVCGVSTHLIKMLTDEAINEFDLSSVRVTFTGGERVPPDKAAEFEQHTDGLVLQFYGSNESGAVSCTTIHDPAPKRLYTAGRPIPSMNVRLVDEDGTEVSSPVEPTRCVVHGPATTPGYYRDDAANIELFGDDGSVLTSDFVKIDADGFLSVVGRASDILIRGGHNISAPAMENEIGAHPQIAAVGVVGIPDETLGERACACIETRDGNPLDLDELLTFLDEKGVSKEMWPEALEDFITLPIGLGGKIDKASLRKETQRRGTRVGAST